MTGSESTSSGEKKRASVLFVCLGNICRSTMAEGVFRHIIGNHAPYSAKIDWKIDSCGTASYHVGDSPDSRTMWTLQNHGITNYEHSGQCVRELDVGQFDYIFAMDQSNLHNLQHSYPMYQDRIMLWGQFSTVPKKDSEGKMIKAKNPPIVDDPYYGGKGGFEQTFKQCKSYSKNFLAYVIEDLIGSSEQIEFPENLFT